MMQGGSRREFLRLGLGVPTALALGAPAVARGQGLPPTPACVSPADATRSQTAGPFFKPSSPRRTSLLEPGVDGRRIVVGGTVLTTDCQPVPGAVVDVWHADDRGEYDNAGYRLRGHQLTDAAGRYRLETIVPGLYPGRTRHFHVRVQAPGQPLLTTQLYFPDEPGNGRDGIFDPALVLRLGESGGTAAGAFDFVLRRRG